MKIKASYLFALIVVTMGCWLVARLGWASLHPGWLIVLAVVSWLLVVALALIAREVHRTIWIVAGLLILGVQFVPASLLVNIFSGVQSRPFGLPMTLLLFLVLSVALVLIAVLLYTGLNAYSEWRNADTADDEKQDAQTVQAGVTVAVVLGLAVLLLARTLHSLYWLTVWDTTNDSLGYLWLGFPILAAFFSGAILSIILSGRTRVAGVVYPLLISAVMVAVSSHAQRVDFRHLTEQRVAQINQEIERYYAREGRYPQDLQELTTWHVRSLPGPVIIYGQDWCYDGGDDYYRLGYVYREHWSDPRLTGRVYATTGEVPDSHGMCEEEIVAIQERYPDYPYQYRPDGEHGASHRNGWN